MLVGGHDNMDPYKSGLIHKVITALLYIFFSCAYVVLKIFYLIKNDDQNITDPKHLIKAPETPIPSRKLAQALNPKTDENILINMAKSEDKFIRRALCRNPSLPKNLLKEMTKDPEPMVANEAKRILEDPTFKTDELHALN